MIYPNADVPVTVSDDRLKMYESRLDESIFSSVEVCRADWIAVCVELRARREFMDRLKKIL